MYKTIAFLLAVLAVPGVTAASSSARIAVLSGELSSEMMPSRSRRDTVLKWIDPYG